MSTNILQRVRDLRHEDTHLTTELFPNGYREQLFNQILNSTTRASIDAPPQRLSDRRRIRLLPRVGALATATATLAAAIVVILSESATSPPAAQAVTFHTAPGDEIIATIANPFAAATQLKADFAAHGLNITVKLIPASPSLVGTISELSEPAGVDIAPLQRGRCVNPAKGCLIGLKIPKNFRGHAGIVIGRPAKPGEQYATAGQATARGEAMYGIRYQGRTVATVLRLLLARHVAVPQYRYTTHLHYDKQLHARVGYTKALRSQQVPRNWVVTNAVPWAPRQVLLFVEPPARPRQ